MTKWKWNPLFDSWMFSVFQYAYDGPEIYSLSNRIKSWQRMNVIQNLDVNSNSVGNMTLMTRYGGKDFLFHSLRIYLSLFGCYLFIYFFFWWFCFVLFRLLLYFISFIKSICKYFIFVIFFITLNRSQLVFHLLLLLLLLYSGTAFPYESI